MPRDTSSSRTELGPPGRGLKVKHAIILMFIFSWLGSSGAPGGFRGCLGSFFWESARNPLLGLGWVTFLFGSNILRRALLEGLQSFPGGLWRGGDRSHLGSSHISWPAEIEVSHHPCEPPETVRSPALAWLGPSWQCSVRPKPRGRRSSLRSKSREVALQYQSKEEAPTQSMGFGSRAVDCRGGRQEPECSGES